MDERKNFRIGIYCAEILVCFVLSGVPGLIPQIFDALPTLLISACTTISLFESRKTAIILGAVGGCLIDISSGSVLGPMGIALTLLCFFISLLSDVVFPENILFHFIALLLSCFIGISSIYFINTANIGLNNYFIFCTYKFIYTFVCTIIVYFLNREISKIKSTL